MYPSFVGLKVLNTRFFLFVLLLAMGGIVSAQRKLLNQPTYDQRPVHFGFSVGMNYYDFRIETIDQLGALNGYYSVRTVVEPGYTISIISNLRLGKYFDLRFNPGFASTVRKLQFDILEPFTQERLLAEREIESSFLEFPLELKFKSQRVNNYRLYLTVGGKYSLDLSSDEDIEDDRVFKLRSNEYAYELGFGIDIYFEYFKFSPQIKGIFGLSNMLVDDDTFLVEGLQSIRTRAILLNLTFE